MKFLQRSFNAMGSPCDLQLYARTHAKARRVADAAIAEVARLEARYSRYREDSLLSQINAVAGLGGSIAVDAETASLLHYADTCHRESAGLFDISSGVLRQAWRFRSGQLPQQVHIDQILQRIGWHKIIWEAPVLTFGMPGMEIDFGGIVKEYAVDRVAALCLAEGVCHGIVNLGGDIKIIGPHPDGSAWQIGIRHPRRQNEVIQTLALRHGALASSGDYERCLLVDGKRYGHILNPKTGWPVQGLAAVSVVADYCVVAGSACTIAMLKEHNGIAWLAEMGLPHLWVDMQGALGGSLPATPST